MTIPSTPRKAGPFLGNGTTTSFPFAFKVFGPTDIKVVIANSAGVETTLVLDSDYSVTLNYDQDTSPGGTVVYPISGSPLPYGSVLSIIGNVSYDQPLDLPSGGNFSPLALENQLDRTTMQIQQLREEMDRTARLPPTSSESVEELVDDLQRIADSADNLDTVANSIANVNTVANSIANVNAVGANIADVATVADNIASVNTAADNIVAIQNAATNASNAAASAAAAATSASSAAASATNAQNSANAASASATAAAASLDAFDDRYLGAKPSDPVTDNDGNALQVGALYWNTSANEMRVWNGSSWQIAAGSLVGNVATATKLQTARTITIGATGKSFDGSANVSWSLAEIGVVSASDTTQGIVELATAAEVQAGTDTVRAVTPVGLAAYAGALSFRNRIINGKMEVSQRGTSWNLAHATPTYTLDRFLVYEDTDGSVSVAQSTDAPTGFQNSLRVTVSTADTALGTTQRCQVEQRIEGYNVRDLVGRDFTLSFWVRSAKTGTHCVSFSNSAIDRSYVAEYTVNAANTWEYKTITVQGGIPNAGTWNFQNGDGMSVRWALCAGSSYQTAAGSWATGDFIASPNQVNVLDTVGNIFAITGVQLEPGSYATQFEHRPYGLELMLCQRYYEVVSFGRRSNNSPVWPNGTPESIVVSFKQEKRATPTIAEISIGAVSHARQYYADTRTVFVQPPSNSSGAWWFYDIVVSASAEL